MVDFGKSDKMGKISGLVDKPHTDNRFSNDILSLFLKDSLIMMGFSKVQHWRK